MRRQTILPVPILMLVLCIVCIQNSTEQISFAATKNYPITGTFCAHLNTGDFNHDGKTDVVVRTGHGLDDDNNWKLFVYLQSSDGELLSPIKYPYHVLESSNYKYGTIASGDVNNDGLCDVVISFKDSIGVFLQNNTGTLNPEVDYYTGYLVDVVKIGDINDDGYNDIIVSSHGYPRIFVFFGEDSGNLSLLYTYPAIRSVYTTLEIGKFGTDTFTSMIRLNGMSNSITQTSKYHIRRDRTLDTVIHYSKPSSEYFSYSLALGNIPGNDKKTLIYSLDPDKIMVWSNFMDLDPVITYTIPDLSAGTLATSDLNCDGRDEICMLRRNSNDVYIISDSIGMNFYLPSPKLNYSDAVAIADINNDGKPDLLSCSEQFGLFVLINTTNCITSVNGVDKREVSTISILPNPCFDFITIKNTSYGENILISDFAGKIVRIFKGQYKNTTINISELKSGLYLVQSSNQIIKFVKS